MTVQRYDAGKACCRGLSVIAKDDLIWLNLSQLDVAEFRKKVYLCGMKRMYKIELARAAGVSPRTFSRWLKANEEELRAVGVKPSDHLVSPSGIRFICEKFDIEMEEVKAAAL